MLTPYALVRVPGFDVIEPLAPDLCRSDRPAA